MKYLFAVKLIGFSVAVSICQRGVAGEEVVDGITWYYEMDDEGATITNGCEKYYGELVVPLSLGGCPVTRIGNYAFSDCKELMSITIPEGVVEIGDCSFMNCSGLISLSMPLPQ